MSVFAKRISKPATPRPQHFPIQARCHKAKKRIQGVHAMFKKSANQPGRKTTKTATLPAAERLHCYIGNNGAAFVYVNINAAECLFLQPKRTFEAAGKARRSEVNRPHAPVSATESFS
jgi:hypothetical protein